MNIKKLHTIFKDECNREISTDTRSIIHGSLFFAWRGEKDDGNKYVAEAFRLGCNYAVVDNIEYVINDKCILVDDSLQILADLAHFHRIQYDIPVIAITGSNGKTTTKELINSVLSVERKTIATVGNLNNHVGVPLTLLSIQEETEIAIIEMGANHVGEIANLCKIAAPNYGLITNIGRAHLGLFGGFEGVIRAKTELYRYLEKTSGTSFINGEDALLLEKSNTLEKITYLSIHSDYPITSLRTMPFVSLEWKNMQIKTLLTGEYNISNIAAAIALGNYFGIADENIVSGIKLYKPENERSEIVETDKGNSIIKDYYNANRSSIECALENLNNIKTDKEKIVILGDIFELGDYENEEHQAVIDQLLNYNLEKVILVGKAFSRISITDSLFEQYQTTDEALASLKKINIKDSYVLLKASHGMNFKKLFENIDW